MFPEAYKNCDLYVTQVSLSLKILDIDLVLWVLSISANA